MPLPQPRPGSRIVLAIALSLVPLLGADGPGSWWSFQPVNRPEPPAHAGSAGAIDAFVMGPLDEAGLEPAPEADRRTLIRRLTFDLTGLPPTPEEVKAFLEDDRDDAYDRLVDRLLASPRYGERQARLWLDLVRFAETHGYERDDPKPNAWRYRDYVVDRFNGDVPYDRFLREQIAGDELPDATDATKTATGWYRLGLIDDEPADPVMDRFDQLDDMVKVIGSSFLGLTLHCARCHDHKFDPIRQTDYYRMLAFFEPAERYKRGDDASIAVDLASESEVRRVADLNRAVDRRLSALRNRLSKEKSEAIKKELEKQIKLLETNRPTPLPMVLGLTDTGATAEPTKLLLRGDAHKPGDEVQPGFLAIIEPGSPTITPPAGGRTSGRRLALARWITRPDNPLTARVMVNRLWQQHFGWGIAGTPSDFGAMGEEPTNPALLDWLASEFIARGWSVKSMHRLIVTSHAYRRSGRWNARAARLDPENRLVWRQSPRRLDAESIRDAALAVSGVILHVQGGPSVRPPIDKAVLAGQSQPGNGWAVSKGRDVFRRSLYVYVKRTLPLPELEVLDAPNPDEPCARRNATTTALQALTLLNSAFWHDQASYFAERLEREAGSDAGRRVERAFQLAFARMPSEDERRDSLAFLESQSSLIAHRSGFQGDAGLDALRAFCLVLFNTNEFVTVD